MMTPGKSEPAMYEIPSPLSEIPGLDEDVIARAPADAAPYTMLIAAISLSACRYVPPIFGMRLDM